MFVKKLALVAAISSVVASSAFAAFTIKAGEWEVETKASMSGAEMPAQPKTKICISPEMAAAYGSSIEEQTKASSAAMPGCKLDLKENTDSKVAIDVVCDLEGMKSDAKTEVNKVSDNEIVTQVVSNMDMGGQKQTMDMKIVQKFVAETCSAEAITPPAPAAK